MSLELANEKWMDGDPKGLLGQWASTKGYTDLVDAATTPALRAFFKVGVTEDCAKVRSELRALALHAPKDVASTALALEKLMAGLPFAMITNGAG